MHRLITALPLVLLATSAFAQDVPATVRKDIWCATAFGLVYVLPEDAAEDMKAEAQPIFDGMAALMARGVAGLKTAGFTDDQIKQMQADLVPVVTEQIQGSGPAEFDQATCEAELQPLIVQPGAGAPPSEAPPSEAPPASAPSVSDAPSSSAGQ